MGGKEDTRNRIEGKCRPRMRNEPLEQPAAVELMYACLPRRGLTYHPLMTDPVPSVNRKGSPLSLEESKGVPSVSVPT